MCETQRLLSQGSTDSAEGRVTRGRRKARSTGSIQDGDGRKANLNLVRQRSALSGGTRNKHKSAGVGAVLRRGNSWLDLGIQRNSLEFRMRGKVIVKDWQEITQDV